MAEREELETNILSQDFARFRSGTSDKNNILKKSTCRALCSLAIELALDGDTVALKLCLDRIVAPRRDRPVHFPIPAMRTAADSTTAMASITSALASGQLTPSEAAELSSVIEAWLRAIESTETERRLSELEKKTNNNAP